MTLFRQDLSYPVTQAVLKRETRRRGLLSLVIWESTQVDSACQNGNALPALDAFEQPESSRWFMVEISGEPTQRLWRRPHKRSLTPEERWIRQLASVWPARRKQAHQALVERGPGVVDLLLTTYRRDDRMLRVNVRRIYFYWIVTTIFQIGGFLFLAWLKTIPALPDSAVHQLRIFLYVWYVAYLGTSIAMCISALRCMMPVLQYPALRNVMADIDDPRVCGPLVDRLKQPDLKHVRLKRQAAEAALVRLLPQLTEQNIPDWTASQRGGLRTVLKRAAKASVIAPESVPLVCAVMEAIATLGDLQAQNVVAQLAKRNPKNDTEIQIIEAAQRCEAALQAWQERNRNGEMLLRGSAQPAAAPETLLRVAPTVASEEPQQLLRATTTEETLP